MSSLKGQLSNVEGSVKSMKAAVVVGSVLTVACLAAVFGVTVAANEVSKEVKVNNGVLANKSGKAVLTTSSMSTTKVNSAAEKVTLSSEDLAMTFAVNAIVSEGTKTTVITDDAVLVYTNDELVDFGLMEGSVLESVLSGGADETEKRSTSIKRLVWKAGSALASAAKKRYASFEGWATRMLISMENAMIAGITYACFYFDICD